MVLPTTLVDLLLHVLVAPPMLRAPVDCQGETQPTFSITRMLTESDVKLPTPLLYFLDKLANEPASSRPLDGR